MNLKTWLDLRSLDDLDGDIFAGKIKKGVVVSVGRLDPMRLRDAMACAAGADDTTRQQERHIRDAIGLIDSASRPR